MQTTASAYQDRSFRRKPRQNALRRVVFTVHLVLGLTLGFLASVTCLTGALVVYKPEIESALLGGVSHLSPLPDGTGAAQSIQAAYEKVRLAYPGCAITQAYLHQPPNLAWTFDLNCKPRGRVVVYYDKYRQIVTGEDHFQGKWTQWIYDLHVHLLTGKNGEIVNGYGGLLLIVLALTGLVVWWPGTPLWRTGFRYEWRARWRRQNYDLHKLLGFSMSALLVLVAFTGAYFAFPKTYESITATLGRGPSTQAAPKTAVGGAKKVNLDQLYATAVAAMPYGETTLLTFPQQPTAPYSLRRMLPGDWRRTGDNLVYLDQYSGQVIRVTYHRDLSLPIRFVRDITPLHFGTFGGALTRVLWIILGIAPAVLYVTGLLMWWNRSLRRTVERLRGRRKPSISAAA